MRVLATIAVRSTPYPVVKADISGPVAGGNVIVLRSSVLYLYCM